MQSSNELIPVSVAQCELSKTAAKFEDGLSYEQWLDAGKQLCRVSACALWWIGDWINYGEKQYGEKYKAALDATDYDLATLHAASWVSSKVQTTNRLVVLTWSHHREVAGLGQKDQRKWLSLAEESKWSVSQMRVAIRQSSGDYRDAKDVGSMGFNPMKEALDFARWFKRQDAEHPIETWPIEQCEALVKDFEPIIPFYERLKLRLQK